VGFVGPDEQKSGFANSQNPIPANLQAAEMQDNCTLPLIFMKGVSLCQFFVWNAPTITPL
jgi:hypothetical protein